MKQLWQTWFLLAVVCLLLAFVRHQQNQPLRLPLPQKIQRVQIIRLQNTLTLTQKNNQWQINGQNAIHFQPWLEQLRFACFAEIPQSELPPEAFANPITLILDNDRWQFAAHNRYAKAHYLHHGKSSYLCDERMKPRLNLPALYWSNPDA